MAEDHEYESDDYDSPWKDLIERYFADFWPGFFPSSCRD